MKNVVVIFFGLMLLVGCGQEAEVEEAQTQQVREWSEHGFAVDFTGEPTYSTSIQQSPVGNYTMHTYQYKVHPELAFQITMEDLSVQFAARNPVSEMNRALQSLSQLLEGDVVQEEVTTQDGFPAKNFEIDASPTLVTGRLVMVQNRLFRVSAFFEVEDDGDVISEVNNFMKSFRILE